MILSALIGSVLLLSPAPPLDLDAARAAWEKGDLDDAARLVEEHLAESADDLEAHLLRSEIRLARQDPDFVLAELDALAATGDARVLVLLGRAYEDIGWRLQDQGASDGDVGYFFGEAQASYGRAAELDGPGSVDGASRAGFLTLYTFNDWRGALDRADKSLERHPGDGELLLLRGCARLYAYIEAKGGEDTDAAQTAWDESVSDLEAAGELLGETRGDAYWQLAWLHEDAGRPRQAVEAAIQHMQRTEGMDIERVYGLAKRYADEREYEASGAALKALVERDAEELANWLASEPSPGEVAVALSWSVGPAVNGGRLHDARGVLEALLTTEPENSDIWNNYGLVCRDTGVDAERRRKQDLADELFAKSYAAYERSLRYDPENPQIMNDTALVMQYHVKTDLGRARELYRKAIERAKVLIEEGDDSSEVRIALRDAKNNLAIMGG